MGVGGSTLSEAQVSELVSSQIASRKLAKESDVLFKKDIASNESPEDSVDHWVSPNYLTEKEYLTKNKANSFYLTKDQGSSFLTKDQGDTSYLKVGSTFGSYAPMDHNHDTVYAKTADLSNYQTAGSYAMASQLANYQTAGSYAMASQLSNYQTAGSYAMASQLANYQPLGNYQTAGSYAMASQLSNYALASQLSNYQTRGTYAMASQLGNYQTAGSYAMASQLSNYALVNQLSNYQTRGDYALANQLPRYQTAGNYVLTGNKAVSNTPLDNDSTWVSPLYLSSKLQNVNLDAKQISAIAGETAAIENFQRAVSVQPSLLSSSVLQDGIARSYLNSTGSYLSYFNSFFNTITGNTDLRNAAGDRAAANSGFQTVVTNNLRNTTSGAFMTTLTSNMGSSGTLQTAVSSNTTLQRAVASNLSNFTSGTFITNLITNMGSSGTLQTGVAGNSTMQDAIRTNLINDLTFRSRISDNLSTSGTFIQNVGSDIVYTAAKRNLLNTSITDVDLKVKLADGGKTLWCADGTTSCATPSGKSLKIGTWELKENAQGNLEILKGSNVVTRLSGPEPTLFIGGQRLIDKGSYIEVKSNSGNNRREIRLFTTTDHSSIMTQRDGQRDNWFGYGV